ncbi:MAG: acyltransferase family protein [Mycolicibacterium sp.]|nr:acyltransferase family protein [Mycolicibacterium sp.]
MAVVERGAMVVPIPANRGAAAAQRARSTRQNPSLHQTSADQLAATVHHIDQRRRTAGTREQAAERPSALAARVAAVAEFVRRRLTGDYSVDEFGFDPHFNDAIVMPLLRTLFSSWFRVEVSGIENVPASGAALIVANHAGVLPLDGLMVSVAVRDKHPRHRALRLLAADMVFDAPVLGQAARKAGHTMACTHDAHRLLARGELTAVFPEGYKGLGKQFRDRYKLQRFGRGGFVSAALRSKAPIVPCSIVGSEEIYPMIADAQLLARLFGLPYFPITPLFPLAGPAGMIPLPSKWHIEFGTPIPTADYGDAAFDDPMLTFELTDHVRETIQQTLYRLVMKRRDVFRV